LSRQCLVKDKPTTAGNAPHLTELIAIGPEFESVGLISPHSQILGPIKFSLNLEN
jgi:hypothetical protein